MRLNILIAKTLDNLRPKSKWTIDNGDYDTLDWRSENTTDKPTREEYEAEYSRLETEYNSKEYQRLRSPEYPELSDFADAYYWMQKGDDTKMNEYLAKIQAVKEKFPKVTNAS